MKRSILASLSSFIVCAACGGNEPTAAMPAASAAPPVTSAANSGGPESAPPAVSAAPTVPSAAAAPAESPKLLTVNFEPKSGSKLAGTAMLTEEATGVKIVIEIAGVSPGDHGAHIHETADCSAPDAKSAGGHYNPDKHDHGLPDGKPRHLGDLGNIVVGKDGKGKLEIVIPDANLKPGDPHSFIGRGIIVHEKQDDGGQPVGNAGGRIGCASIVSK
jgi:Cu-Zn family superoxide dismutase